MRKFPKKVLIAIILILASIVLLSSIKIVGKPVSIPSNKLYATWTTYKNNTSNYSIQIPNTWDISEKKNLPYVDSLVVFTPKKNSKYTSSLVITSITASSHPKIGEPLTTQTDFDTWLKKDPKKFDPHSRLNKLNNFTANNNKAVIFIDSGYGGELKANEWSLVTWFRHKGSNFYIYTKGKSKISPADIAGYTHMLITFKFN